MSNKTKNIIVWTLSVILALFYLMASFSKLTYSDMQVKGFTSYGYPLWFMYPVGIIEVLMAISLLIPKTRLYGIYSIFAWAIIVLITHLRVGQTNMIAPAIVAGIIGGIFLFIFKKETKN